MFCMTIGVWGDSITYGAGDSEALGWVGRLRKALPTGGMGDIEVYNFGICGQTSTDLLARFDSEADGVKPNIVMFAIGINDSKYLADEPVHNVPVPDYKMNLQLLIEKARAHTGNIALLSATKVHDGWRTQRGSRFFNEGIAEYNETMRTLADAEKVIFIDVFETIDPDIDLEDGLHPNAGGYQKLFEAVSEALNIKV